MATEAANMALETTSSGNSSTLSQSNDAQTAPVTRETDSEVSETMTSTIADGEIETNSSTPDSESTSSGAVEVIAHVAGDGSLRTRSISLEESSKASLSLVDNEETPLITVDDADFLAHCHSQKSKSESINQTQDVQPELIPIGSNSDSDDSFLSEDGDAVEDNSNTLIVQSSAEVAALAPTNSQATSSEVSPIDDTVGMYDCLTDQFTSLFCPVCPAETTLNACLRTDPKTGTTTAATSLTNLSCEVGCPDYGNLFASGREASDVFSSLQFWLTPSQEEELKLQKPVQPHNRSSYSRKRKAKHVQSMWDSWHPEATIPLERSKSFPEKLGMLDTLASLEEEDVCYDSDPEQEHARRTERCKQLHRPAPVRTRTPSSSSFTTTTNTPPLPRRRSYKDFRPSPLVGIGTIWEGEPYEDHGGRARSVPPTPRNSMAGAHSNFSFLPPLAMGPPLQDDADEDYAMGAFPTTPTHVETQESQRFFESPTGPTDYDMMHPDSDATLRQFIQEATNTKIPLTWHRRTKTNDSCSRLKAPVAVMGAFEVGAHLDNLVVQPKFTWSPVHEPHLDQRKIRLSGNEPDAIELLSIIRVVKPTQLNSKLYPFARLDRTCCITTNDENFPYLVLEARSSRERDWLVNALKMIVARLASIIIVRDEAMLLEFFTPYAALMNMDADQHEEAMAGAMPCPTAAHEDFEQREDGPTLEPNGELQLISYGGP